MANAAVADDPELDLKVKKKGGGGMMKIIMIVAGVVVIMAVSVGTAVYVSKSLIQDSISHGPSAPAHGEKAAHGSASHGSGHAAKEGEGEGATGEAKYVKLGDAFVVNFMAGDQIRYLQVTIEVMTHDPAVPGEIETHLPVIRNNLVMLFSGLDYKTLSSVEGKQKIREQTLHEVQKILEERTGDPGVDDLYFTSFVMQ